MKRRFPKIRILQIFHRFLIGLHPANQDAPQENKFSLANELEQAKQEGRNTVALAESKAANELQRIGAAKDAEIQELRVRLDAEEVARQLAVTEAVGVIEKERDGLANELEQAKQEGRNTVALAESKAEIGRAHV